MKVKYDPKEDDLIISEEEEKPKYWIEIIKDIWVSVKGLRVIGIKISNASKHFKEKDLINIEDLIILCFQIAKNIYN